jgi:hypothetical protein
MPVQRDPSIVLADEYNNSGKGLHGVFTKSFTVDSISLKLDADSLTLMLDAVSVKLTADRLTRYRGKVERCRWRLGLSRDAGEADTKRG